MSTRAARPGFWPRAILVAGAAGLLSLAWLAFHAAPGLNYHDGGEFALAAGSAGIPHPPGSPVWVLLASSFARWTGFADNPARGANLFSSFCGAGTIALVCLFVQVWAAWFLNIASARRRTAMGVAASLFLLQSPAFLEQSAIAEQYALLAFLLALFLLTAAWCEQGIGKMRGNESAQQQSRALAAGLGCLGLVWGLSMGNHFSQVSLAFVSAWILIRALAASKSLGLMKQTFHAAAFAFGLSLGLSVYLWIPWRSRSNPLIDFGNIDSLERLIGAFRRDYWPERSIFETPPGFVSEWLASYALPAQLGWLTLTLAAIGVVALGRRRLPGLGWILGSVAPGAALILAGHMKAAGIDGSYLRQYGVTDWHLPVYLAFSLLASAGFGLGADWFIKRRRTWALLAASAVLAWSGGRAWRMMDRHSLKDFQEPIQFVQEVIGSQPDDALLLLAPDNLYFMSGYYRHFMNSSPNLRLAFDSPSIKSFTARRKEAGAPLTRDLFIQFIRGQMMNPDYQPIRVGPLSAEDLKSRPFITEYSPVYPRSANHLAPSGLLFELRPVEVGNEEVLRLETENQKRSPELFRPPPPGVHRWTREAWGALHQWRGGYFAEREMWRQALAAYSLSLEWMQDNARLYYCLGDCHENLNRGGEAIEAYRRAIQQDPFLPGPRSNLAVMLAKSGRLEAARTLLLSELELDPDNPAVRRNLELIQQQLGL